MNELELANRFDRQRPQLRAVAYRILSSMSEAEDAVQEAWLRLQRTDPEQIDSLERWLTTVVARICLNMLRSRRARGEQPLDGFVPEPIVDDPAVGTDGEPLELRGAANVARGAMSARRFAPYVRPALINGAAGVVAFDGERPFAVLALTVIDNRAAAIDVFNDPELVAKLDIRGITA
jgi:Sigma-70 region 2